MFLYRKVLLVIIHGQTKEFPRLPAAQAGFFMAFPKYFGNSVNQHSVVKLFQIIRQRHHYSTVRKIGDIVLQAGECRCQVRKIRTAKVHSLTPAALLRSSSSAKVMLSAKGFPLCVTLV